MLNFTIGPVQSNEKILAIGGEQIPYFRTKDFSNTVNECEMLIKKLVGASQNDRTIFLTGSGTAAMESAIINTLTKDDSALIVNGGTFGQRFVDLCILHNIKYTDIKLEFGKTLTKEDLLKFNGKNYTCFIINSNETSSGTKYDMNLVSSYCKENNLFLIVDAIGSVFADEFNMKDYNADVVLLSSHKGLACAPGISMVILSEKAISKINNVHTKTMYLDYKLALENAKRGQTPFTPAIGIIRQIYERLKEIDEKGYESEVSKTKILAEDFRKKISSLPFKIVSNNPSNALTALYTKSTAAKTICSVLQEKYNIWVCPNGGEYEDTVFRVGHIGNLTTKDNDTLVNALLEMKRDNIF